MYLGRQYALCESTPNAPPCPFACSACLLNRTAAAAVQLLPASVAAASASSQSPRFHPTAFQSSTPPVLALCFTSAPMAAPSASLPQPQASGSESLPSLSWLEGLAGWLAPLRGLGSTPSGLAAASTAGMAHTPGSSVHLAPCSGTSAAIPHPEGAMTGATSGAGPAAVDPRLGPALSNLGDAYRLQVSMDLSFHEGNNMP